MPLENPVKFTIDELDPLSPTHNEFVSQGDDHLRNIKGILKTQFSGANGNGLEAPVVANAKELNALRGIDTSQTIQAQLRSIRELLDNMFPVGTKLLWLNKTIPPGWRIESTGTADAMIKILSSSTNAGEINDGYNAFDVKAADLPPHTHALTINAGGNHVHGGIYTDYSDHEHASKWTSRNGGHSHPGSAVHAAGNHSHSYQRATKHVGYTGGTCCALATPEKANSVSTAGNHNHSLTIAGVDHHSHEISFGWGSGGNHRHGPFNTSTAGHHTHSAAIHNNVSNNKKPKSINACIIIRVS